MIWQEAVSVIIIVFSQEDSL